MQGWTCEFLDVFLTVCLPASFVGDGGFMRLAHAISSTVNVSTNEFGLRTMPSLLPACCNTTLGHWPVAHAQIARGQPYSLLKKLGHSLDLQQKGQ
jgi:hypothetical protein